MENITSTNLDLETRPLNPEEPGQTAEDPVFFNVMPKTAAQGSFVEPKVKVSSTLPSEAPKQDIKQIFKKYKWYAAGAAGVIVLGIGGYFLINFWASNSYKQGNYLATAPKVQSPKPQAPAQTPDFTTPKEWRNKYFPNCADAKICGDNADPDHDGLSNIEEYKAGTDPNNPDSDQDGLSDGDEIKIFGTDPLNSHTAGNPKYSDADFISGGFDIATNKKLMPTQIAVVTQKMREFGLHEPTLTKLGNILASLYGYQTQPSASTATSTMPSIPAPTASSTVDQSVEAKQGRDAQRSDTIKNLEIALVKYQTDNKSYPQTSDFNVMYSQVKLYLKVATNPIDPLNTPPYVYSYSANASGSDFSLSFFSEVAGQAISKNAAGAIKDANSEQSAIYDNQRETDLESIRTALLLYSQNNVAGGQDYVFPTKGKYKTAIVPQYISVIPVDPKTNADYGYEVSPTFNTFTLKTLLDNPPTGATGYMCNQDNCQNY